MEKAAKPKKGISIKEAIDLMELAESGMLNFFLLFESFLNYIGYTVSSTQQVQ